MENIGLNKSILLNSKFAIHGTSSLGKQCYEWLKDNGLSKNIVCFSDNNKQKQGTEIYSIPIISLDEIKDDSINIIISTMFIKEVYRDIKMLGLHNAVFCYIDLECPYGEEKFDDDRSLLSLYDDDLRTNQLIDDFYKFRTSNVFRLYPIDDAIRLSGSEEYWCMEDTKLNYDALTICDIGAYSGDSCEMLLQEYKENIQRIYSFELDPNNFKILEKKTDALNELFGDIVIPYNLGLYHENTMIKMKESDYSDQSHISKHFEGVMVQLKRLDDICLDVKGKLCIKMDVEGAEINVLKGAESVIKTYEPEMAICVYHRANDIVDIPKYLRKINPKYKFRLRGGQHLICYASV